jgi:hypothetical protein
VQNIISHDKHVKVLIRKLSKVKLASHLQRFHPNTVPVPRNIFIWFAGEITMICMEQITNTTDGLKSIPTLRLNISLFSITWSLKLSFLLSYISIESFRVQVFNHKKSDNRVVLLYEIKGFSFKETLFSWVLYLCKRALHFIS